MQNQSQPHIPTTKSHPSRESPPETRRFWNWVQNEGEPRTLYLEGPIAEETWWGDEVTPKLFKDDLMSGSGMCEGAPPITVWINSPGGDVFAAAQIYNMLMDYRGEVTVKIDGIAASAASVIAMAGTKVLMSPVSMLMIHNPSTIAIGDAEEMTRAKEMLDEVKESIMNAYEIKTDLSRAKLSHMMDAESWMNAKKAVELGFADDILFSEDAPVATPMDSMIFSRQAVYNSLLKKLPQTPKTEEPGTPTTPHEAGLAGTPVESLLERLNLISH